MLEPEHATIGVAPMPVAPKKPVATNFFSGSVGARFDSVAQNAWHDFSLAYGDGGDIVIS